MARYETRPTKRVLVCGQRDYTNFKAVLDVLSIYGPGTTIIHGAAPGADTLAEKAAHVLGFKVEAYPAKWTVYGRAAGPVRNAQMLREGNPEIVIAFYKKGGQEKSKGTNHMVGIARKAEVAVLVVEDL